MRFPLLLSAAFCLCGGMASAHPADWRVEAEAPAKITFPHGGIEINTPKGLTLWYRRRLSGAVRISFDAKPIAAGGPNDTVSDLNAFWMARESDGADPMPRSGRFEDYDTLQTYYVGLGGNRNTTTRLRRYIATPGVRPLLPEHDRSDAPLAANRWTHIALIADGAHIAVDRDGLRLFTLTDPAPYTSGWFGLRTTWSHWAFRHIRIKAQQ
jgi:hypothetical protein